MLDTILQINEYVIPDDYAIRAIQFSKDGTFAMGKYNIENEKSGRVP